MRFWMPDVGFYELNPFPGCNQLVVSNHAYITPEWRGKGYGKEQHEQRLKNAKDMGYDCIVCTVHSSNDKEKTILSANGWKTVHAFKNRETGHQVEIWVKNLGE